MVEAHQRPLVLLLLSPLTAAPYTPDARRRGAVSSPAASNCRHPKPFSLDAFIRKVREVLDAPRPGAARLATGDDRGA